MKSGNHHLWMLIGCLLPFFLIFLAPVFGIGNNISFFIFIVAMFGCHFMMMGRHHKHEQNKNDKPATHQH